MKISSTALLLVAFSIPGVLFSADASGKRIPAGSKIFVEAEAGFDAYLAAALGKKKVPLTMVSEKENADYLLIGSSAHEEKGWASKIFLGHRDSSDATIKLVERKSGEIIYAYAVHKKNSARANQSTAEACAKHLKEAVQK